MRDSARIDRILDLLRAYWHANPDLRLGQSMWNLTPHPRPGYSGDVFYVEDDVIEKALLAAVPPVVRGDAAPCRHDIALGECAECDGGSSPVLSALPTDTTVPGRKA